MRLLSVREAAEELGRSREFVLALGRDGLIDVRRRGRRFYVPEASLRAWVDGGAPEPAPAEPIYVMPRAW